MNFGQLFFCYFTFTWCIHWTNGQFISLSSLRSFYFDPNTALTSPVDATLASQPNGVIIVEFGRGNLSKICMNYLYANMVAELICKQMNYTLDNNILSSNPKAPKGFAMISTMRYPPVANLQIVNCSATDCLLQYQTPFPYSPCDQNNQDLHIFCTSMYNASTFEICRYETCILMRDSVSQAIYVVSNGTNYSFCGSNNNFGQNEAIVFCMMLGQYNSTVTPLIVNTAASFSVGGFKSMTCPVGSTDIRNCTNLNPWNRSTCTPTSNIGVQCTPSAVVTVKATYPTVNCSATSMTLYWNLSTFGYVNSSYVDITYLNGTICTNTVKYTDSNGTGLTVNYGNCSMSMYVSNSSISYMFSGQRSYPFVNGASTKANDIFNASCILPRFNNQSQGLLSINSAALPPQSGTVNNDVTLTIYSDPGYTNSVSNVNSVAVGTTIYVKLQLQSATPNLVLILINCNMVSTSDNTLFVMLINNKCPVYPGVVINLTGGPSTSASFSFPSFIFDLQGQKVQCSTINCISGSTGCVQSC